MSMLIETFETTVKQYTRNPAIQVGDTSVTYRELNRRINKLAHFLLREVVSSHRGDPFQASLLLDKGIDMIVSLWGVLKAGMAYVPMDPHYPENRLLYMLDHSQSRAIITDKNNLQLARAIVGQSTGKPLIIVIEELDPALPENNPGLPVADEQRAYILYTSGSTGHPKGVEQLHKNMFAFTMAWIKRLDITSRDRMSLLTAFTHDGAITDIFGALLSGALLLPFDIKTTLNQDELAAFVAGQEVTIWHSVPTLYRYFLNTIAPDQQFPRLRFILLGGEALREHDVTLGRKYFPKTVIVNVYGQTESTIDSFSLITPEQTFQKVTLGHPIDDVEILLVDDNDEIVEEMGSGEIVIVSDYLASGYWQDPDETERKFTYEPDIGRMFWTGDLGAYLGNGEIEYLGRKDYQVKIRGFRIETGEVESVLLRLPEMKEVAVVLRENQSGESYLVAYWVPEESYPPVSTSSADDTPESEEARFRDSLARELPDYMVPARFIRLKEMPLTGSGKIDRRTLPQPGETTAHQPFVPPKTGIEKALVQIWQDVLYGDHNAPAPIGLKDNFFRLGGHSLRAMFVISRVHKILNVRLDLEDIFNYTTLEELAAYISSCSQDQFRTIPMALERKHYTLSSAQERMYVLNRMDETNLGYNIVATLEVKGPLEIPRLEKALGKLIQRHEILRTSFHMWGGQPIQRIHQDVPVALETHRIDPHELDEFKKQFKRPFDLSRPSQLRVAAVEVGKDHHDVLFDMHHIISDGGSIGIFMKELFALYQGEPLAPLKRQYKDYSEWQVSDQHREELALQETYWLNVFQPPLPVLVLPYDYPRPGVQQFTGAHYRFPIEGETVAGLRGLTIEHEATMFMVVLAAYNVLLSKLANSHDIVVGTPTAGRNHADLESLIGMFVNTLALRNYPEPGKSFGALLQEVKTNTLAAFENQDYQFEDLVEKAGVTRDTGRHPLFDTMFTFQDSRQQIETSTETAVEADIPMPDLSVTRKSMKITTSQFDLSVVAIETNNQLTIGMTYSTHLFKRETLQQFGGYFKRLLDQVAKAPTLNLSEIDILSPEEKERLLVQFNDTAVDYPIYKTIHRLFEEQVQRNPHRVALTAENRVHISYARLNRDADALARSLREKGIHGIVAIRMARSVDMMVALLGVLKAGAAYLPIDPALPKERIRYMLEDSNAMACVDSIENYKVLGTAQTERSHHTDQSAAYVIYTSGSTGQPKGTILEHAGVVNRLMWMEDMFGIQQHHTFLQKTTYTFDVSVWELFLPLITGARLVLAKPGGEKDPAYLYHAIQENHVSIVHFVPSMLNAFLQYFPGTLGFSALEYCVCSGETLTPAHKDLFFAKTDGTVQLHNLYGPTEASVDVTAYRVSPDDTVIPIGKPVPNTRLYILDTTYRPVPVGVTGELVIQGIQVARGYLNRPQLTGQKFLTDRNPFFKDHTTDASTVHQSPQNGDRQYATGDLCRWLTDGNIEFLGRIDHQVKIRGYRIETGEIEAQLTAHPDVEAAAVLECRRGDGSNYLCAYIQPMDKTIVTENEPAVTMEMALKNRLTRLLPEYMVPATFVFLEAFPLTDSGKLHRSALPETTAVATGVAHRVPPVGATEEIVASVWADILGIDTERIGRDTNLFSLGANSLHVIKFASAIKQELSLDIPIMVLFKNPSVGQIATVITNGTFADSQESEYVLFNGGQENTIFAFPPALAYGIIYLGLAYYLKEYSVYAFNFIESQDPVDSYVQIIQRLQPEGAITLLAYSASGEMTLEVAHRLEQVGRQVEDILLLDAYRGIGKKIDDTWRQQFMRNVHDEIQKNGIGHLKEQVIRKVDAFREYAVAPKTLKPVNGNIHLLVSEDHRERYNATKDSDRGWASLAPGKFVDYTGSGIHADFLHEPHLERNAQIIHRVLEARNPVIIPEGAQESVKKVSGTQARFLDYAMETPEVFEETHFRKLLGQPGTTILNPWPLFTGPELNRQMREAGEAVIKIYKEGLFRIFGKDAQKIGQYFNIAPALVAEQLRFANQEYLDALIARGDYYWTEKGFKCLEFNVATNLGGLDLPMRIDRYCNVPLIARFLQQEQLTLSNPNLHTVLFEHLCRTFRSYTGGVYDNEPLHIAIAGPNFSINEIPRHWIEIMTGNLQDCLNRMIPGSTGDIFLCDFSDLETKNDTVYYKDTPVRLIIEVYRGAIPQHILELVYARKLLVLNGPFSPLLSNKLNLALLSTYSHTSFFDPRESQLIDQYIPWTRKILPGETLGPDRETVELVEFLKTHRERLVLKPSSGLGGQGVVIGKQTPASQWLQKIGTALEEKSWLVQELMVPLPLLFQNGRKGCALYDSVWGIFVMGNRFGGNILRSVPHQLNRGVVNVAQGATGSVTFEVDR